MTTHELPDEPVFAFTPAYDLPDQPQQIRIVFEGMDVVDQLYAGFGDEMVMTGGLGESGLEIVKTLFPNGIEQRATPRDRWWEPLRGPGRPGSITPGQRSRNGTRCPPS